MDEPDIWTVVNGGDISALQKLLQTGVPLASNVAKQVDENRCTLLHRAVLSKRLEMVKLVTQHFHPDQAAENLEGLTPLMLACQEESPIEIITYLMGRMDREIVGPTPLDFAVFQNRVDLARAVIEHESNNYTVEMQSVTTALHVVATQTGNPEMLQCLLDAPGCVGSRFVTEKIDGATGIEALAQTASYPVESKVACFQLLYNVLHPLTNPDDRRRYNVNDVLELALYSLWSVSLVPHFIETEQKWESRESIRSLYERCLPTFDLLALVLLCEYGPVTVERAELDLILQDMCPRRSQLLWYDQLARLFINAIYPERTEDGPSPMEALKLLEDLAAFSKTITLDFFRTVLRDGVLDVLCRTPSVPICGEQEPPNLKPNLYKPSCHQAIECMMTIYASTADNIVEGVIAQSDELLRALVIFPLLRYCTTLLMHPGDIVMEHLKDNRLLNWFVHLFGPWEGIRQHAGKPVLEVFTLKRFARDVVREAVWRGVRGSTRVAKLSFLERLQSLDMPKELKEYLRYCDYSSTKYFVEHLNAAKSWLNAHKNDSTVPNRIMLLLT